MLSKAGGIYGRVLMFGLAGSVQESSIFWGADQMVSRMRHSVRVLVLLACGVAVLLSVGVAPAFAVRVSKAEEAEAAAHEERFVYRPSGEREGTEECYSFENICHKGESVTPPGEYLESRAAGWGIRVHEFAEEYCQNVEPAEGCVLRNNERPEKSANYLAPGYKELYQTIDRARDVDHYFDEVHESYLVFIYAWKPVKRRPGRRRREQLGSNNPGEKNAKDPCKGDPVDCATGNETESQADISIPALGVPFDLERTYNSQAAAEASSPGLFGYGWSSSFGDRLEFNTETDAVTVVQANGSTVVFFGSIGTPGEFTAPSWAQAKLVYTEAGTYKYTLPNQETFTFNSSGRLLSESERNSNTTTMTYHEEEVCEGGCHEVLKSIQIADPAGRKITLTLNGGGQVESATDPMGHVVHYGYEGGDLASVTEPGESSPRWRFKYDAAHQLTEMTNGIGGHTTNEYNEAHQVVSQTGPLGQKLHFTYEEIASKGGDYSFPGIASETSEEEDEEEVEFVEIAEGFYVPSSESKTTTITNENTGAVEHEHFNSEGELETVTRAAGAPIATTESFTYNSAGELTKAIDGDSHATEYGYDAAGDKTSEKDANGDETKWKYNTTHDVETATTPKGETTTIKRDSHGNPEVIERPAPGGKTQKTTYKYDSHGDLTSETDALERTRSYEYDSYGDRTTENSPAGKRTWEYNEDSQEISTVSPRGNVTGGEPAKFTTKIERDAQGRPLKVTDPLAFTTKYTYDGDGNLATLIDGNNHKTTYFYDADNEPIKVEQPNKATTETGYDGLGQVTSQTDANKHTTKYVRNLLEEVTEVVDPLGHKTTKEYDPAGNLVKLTDPAKRTTTYTYDPGNRLKEIVYSSGKPATIKYEYDKDGDRTSMTDGTGTTTYTFDQLDRLTESKDGHGDVAKYEYDLDNEPTKITYPNGKAITRAYDNAGRLQSVADWLEHTTKFSYDADSDLADTNFPAATEDVDKYEHNQDDQMSSQTMTHGTETLASLAYAHDGDDQVTSGTVKGLPGEEKPSYEYDPNNRLTKGLGTAYEYDAANNPTKIGAGTYKYNAADQLESGPSLTYTYDELGERTKTKPTTGPATTYGYDQAGNLTSVERPKEGTTPEIKDTYAYNGEDLRTSQTVSGTTGYLAWDMAEELPLILSDGTNSYIYGPGGLPVEQVSSGGTVTYLHHDQQGSTRLLTGSTGKTEATFTYDAYGNQTGHTGTATTPLGYDGEYTSPDTGLIYMRARVYDPATAQFLSRDPLAAIGGEPYSYAGDNPINASDPTGLLPFGIKLPSWEEGAESVAGWGDKFTFGLTKDAREALGDENVNACSTAYQAGGTAGLLASVVVPGGDIADALRFSEDQDALIQLASEAKRTGGLTPEDTETLREWAEEYGVNFRGPEIHPNRNFNIYHVHIGPVSHIPTSVGPVQP